MQSEGDLLKSPASERLCPKIGEEAASGNGRGFDNLDSERPRSSGDRAAVS